MRKTEITISNVTYRVKDKVILNNISLTVENGDSFALLGENGSGKSTLIDVMLGDLILNEGNVSIPKNSKNHFNNVGVLYTDMPLFDMLKVNEIIKYYATIRKLDYNNIKKRYFGIFKIEKIYSSFIKELSQGEKKRIGLLLTIMHEPDLLILDEPFTNLDPTIINRIWKTIKQEKRTVFFTTHNWKEAESLSNKICFIFNGKIINNPIQPREVIESLPATKKIIVKTDPEIIRNISNYQFYKHDDDLNIFFDQKTDLFNIIRKYTYNFSVQDVDLKDAYLYYIKKTKNND